jgi:hypothetical protein
MITENGSKQVGLSEECPLTQMPSERTLTAWLQFNLLLSHPTKDEGACCSRHKILGQIGRCVQEVAKY